MGLDDEASGDEDGEEEIEMGSFFVLPELSMAVMMLLKCQLLACQVSTGPRGGVMKLDGGNGAEDMIANSISYGL
jgi:hypothetical protein